MDKKSLSERDICTKFVAPAIQRSGWDIQRQVREEVSFTKGRIIVRGKLHVRGKSRRADLGNSSSGRVRRKRASPTMGQFNWRH